MSNSKLKCTYCGERKLRDTMKQLPGGNFCNIEHATLHGQKKARATKAKRDRAKHKQDKENIRTRSEWFDIYGDLVRQWVLHVRDAGKPCFTCGTTSDIKYDAGHYRSQGACPELSMEPRNIHKQCSVNCNQHGSGMRAEYREAIVAEYGKERLEWLDGPHPTLKEQFPEIEDIKREIQRYRKLIRDAGLRPRR